MNGSLCPKGDNQGAIDVERQDAQDDPLQGNVPDPDLATLTVAMRDAYTEVRQLSGNADLPWQHNFRTDTDLGGYLETQGGQMMNLSAEDYWVVYVVGGYEIGPLYVFYVDPVTGQVVERPAVGADPPINDTDGIDNDPYNDPDRETRGGHPISSLLGYQMGTDPTNIQQGRRGAMVAMESIWDVCHQWNMVGSFLTINQIVTAHEIGHKFGLEHTRHLDGEKFPAELDLMWVPWYEDWEQRVPQMPNRFMTEGGRAGRCQL